MRYNIQYEEMDLFTIFLYKEYPLIKGHPTGIELRE